MNEQYDKSIETIDGVAQFIRDELKDTQSHCEDMADNQDINNLLLFAYNNIGKTRLSVAFKDIGKNSGNADTLYFNAFTEDLFTWDNDLQNDSERILKLNPESKFFSGLEELQIEDFIRPILNNYANFDFDIDYDIEEIGTKHGGPKVTFSRTTVSSEQQQDTISNIKISRGEENLFIWCFFLAVATLAIGGEEKYNWVKFIYIDDPVSSLDENNAIAVAQNLADIINRNNSIKCIISTHHSLFFNVLCSTIGKANQYFLSKNRDTERYSLTKTGDTPFFYHVAMLAELRNAVKENRLFTYHYNILCSILEKTASFHGYKKYTRYINVAEDGTDAVLHKRFLNVLSHGGHSLYEPQEMDQEYKNVFKRILDQFLNKHDFNIDALPETEDEQEGNDHG